MKIGNISQTVLKRSVLKQLKTKRDEAIFDLSTEEMCFGVSLESNSVVASTATVYGDEKDLGYYGIAKAVNDIASRNAKAVGVEIVIQLPPYAYESRLKAMVTHMEACCKQNHLQILGIKATVCPIISSANIHVTALGIANETEIIQTAMAKSEMDIVLIGSVGMEGALRILNKKQEEIEQRFIPSFFDSLKRCKEQLMLIEEIDRAIAQGAVAIHQLGEGGILAALWEVGEAGDLGLEVDLKKMTIRQDVIEICEFVGVNPYLLSGTGSVLVMLEDGESLVEKLQDKAIPCSVIGKTTDHRERVILNGGEKRFLDRPAQGELMKLYNQAGETDD